LKKWNVVTLIETWTEEKGWEKVKKRLPGGFVWRMQGAKKKRKKGRAIGGLVMGIRKEWWIREDEAREEKEGIIVGKVKYGKGSLRIVGVYVSGDMEKKLEEIKGWMEEKEEGRKMIIGGDFNARTGREGGRVRMEGEGEERERNSKDSRINKEGRMLVEGIRERGWMIMNGGIEGDEEGEWTYTGGRGESVIDYIIGDEEVREEIVKLEIGDRVESDQHPVVAWMRGGEEARKREGGEKRIGRGVWDEEGREVFRAKLGSVEIREGRVQDELEEMGKRVREAMGKAEGEREGKRKGGG